MLVTIPQDIRAQLFTTFKFPRPRLRRIIIRLLYYNIGNNYFLTCLSPHVSLAFWCHIIRISLHDHRAILLFMISLLAFSII